MNFPITFGLPQIILMLLVILGIGLFISSVMSLRRYRVEKYIDEYGRRRILRRRHYRWGRSVSGVALLLVAVVLLWLTTLAQTYIGLTGEVRAASVHATPITNMPHMMSVELTQYDSNQQPISKETYVVNGDEWMLQANFIEFHPWLNIFGLHSGYKLTRLEGRFDDPDMERHHEHTVIVLNGGDDDFFKTVKKQSWYSPFVKGMYGTATFLPADGKTYNIMVSQDTIKPVPAK
ncbi:MAG: hypothetical protein IMW89_19330 [Ktedonobacteraceae bacterium]|nr:hypothetical protein [Ktedonobacteraceae bacterium]